MKKWLLVLPFVLSAFAALSQTDSTGKITFTGFVDAYYAYDFNNPQNHERPGFLYNHNRHNEFNVNLALVKVAYESNLVRGHLALMAGTYAQYNLASEQALLQHIYEANAGVRLAQGLWLEAGIFPSHIGLEGAISKDNYTLTRSLAAENSPYYESGVKLTYSPASNWVFSGLVLNGWQNIREPEGNSGKAVGTQVQYKPNDSMLLNSSFFMGNEKPDSTRQRRYFHDFYLTFQFRPQLKLAAVFDIGLEKKLNKAGYNTWYSPALLVHYSLSDQVALAARAEYYRDKNGVIITNASPAGFKTSGYSINLDYAATGNVLVRVEGRLLNSQDPFLTGSNQKDDKSLAITSSLAVSF